jgi:hypothetical protein
MTTSQKKPASGGKGTKNKLHISSRTMPGISEFTAWRDALGTIDRMNFDTLMQLPSALEVIARMPEGQYQDMAICGLALTKALDSFAQTQS